MSAYSFMHTRRPGVSARVHAICWGELITIVKKEMRLSAMSNLDRAYNRLESWSLTLHHHLKDHRQEISSILDGKVALPAGCPSRAAAAALAIGQILQDGDEIADALKNLQQIISDNGTAEAGADPTPASRHGKEAPHNGHAEKADRSFGGQRFLT
jgi:hypothetical protein